VGWDLLSLIVLHLEWTDLHSPHKAIHVTYTSYLLDNCPICMIVAFNLTSYSTSRRLHDCESRRKSAEVYACSQTSPSESEMHTRSIIPFETNHNRRPGLSTSQSIHLRRNYSTVSIAQALVGVTCHTTILRRRSEITWRNHFTFLTWGTYSSRLMSQKPVERWNRFRPVWPVGVCTDSVLVLLLQRLNGAFFRVLLLLSCQ
jgi:hypothetical protein